LHVAELGPQDALNQTLHVAETTSRHFHRADFRQNEAALPIDNTL
jgi:hypothetical protein